MTPLDLCAIAETCKRFQQIAQRVFPTKLNFPRTKQGYWLETKHYSRGNHNERDVKRICMNFGPCITELCICLQTDEHFWIDEIRNWNAILQNTFPKLKRFSLMCGTDTLHLLRFLQRHKGLKALKLCKYVEDRYKTVFWQAISNCKELEELTIGKVYDWKPDLSKLQNLKQLHLHTISGCATEYIVELQALQSLETLTIDSVRDDGLEFFKSLERLKNVREMNLVFQDYLKDTTNWKLLSHLTKLSVAPLMNANVGGIIKQLTNLEKLEIPRFYAMHKRHFLEIVKIVEGRPHMLTIKCRFRDCLKDYCNEYRNVRLINI